LDARIVTMRFFESVKNGIFISAIAFFSNVCPTYAQDAALLRTNDFVVTKSGAWCAQQAEVTATATGSAGQAALATLASEIKFIFEFECPIAKYISVDLVGADNSVKPYSLSQDTHWKLVEKPLGQSNVVETGISNGGYLSSWRPDQTLGASGLAQCKNGTLAKSSPFLRTFKYDETKFAFYELAEYSSKLANADRNYVSSLTQIETEKANLKYQIENDEKRRSRRVGGLFTLKTQRSDAAKSAIRRLNEIGNDDPVLQSIIEIAFDRIQAIDALKAKLGAEMSAFTYDAKGFDEALTARQYLIQSRSCIGWSPNNSNLIKFMPEIIEDYEDDFFTSVENKFDQVLRDRLSFAKVLLLARIKNTQDEVSLEYFWDAYPDYIQNAYKSDSEISRIYNSRLVILKAETLRARAAAEKKALDDERERQSEEYNSAFLQVALPPQNFSVSAPFLSSEERSFVEQHETAQLNSVGEATRLSPEICTTTRSQILYGGWASGGATESTSCSPQVNVGKERQRKFLASKGPSSSELSSVCSKHLKPDFCKCLSEKNKGHFTQEEYSLFSKSPRAYISFIKERDFMRYTHGMSSSADLNDSASISEYMESGAINTLMEVGAERMGNIFTGIAALMQGNAEGAVHQFRKAQLMVPSNAGDLTTYCIATSQ